MYAQHIRTHTLSSQLYAYNCVAVVTGAYFDYVTESNVQPVDTLY